MGLLRNFKIHFDRFTARGTTRLLPDIYSSRLHSDPSLTSLRRNLRGYARLLYFLIAVLCVGYLYVLKTYGWGDDE